MRKHAHPLISLFSVTLLVSGTLLLGACGSDNSSTTTAAPSCTAGSVCGTAATGAAMAGAAITAKCKGNFIKSTTADASGYYSVQPVPSENLPCMIEASKGTDKLYSVTSGSGNFSHVTLLSTLVVTKALGADPETTFATLDADDLLRLGGPAVTEALEFIRSGLTAYIEGADGAPPRFNPMTSPLTAATSSQAGNFYDFLLDRFKAANPDMATLIANTVADSLVIAPPPSTFSISGSVLGAAEGKKVSWSLLSNGLWRTNGESSNGEVTFTPSGGVLNGLYEVVVTASPVGQTCAASSPGIVSGTDITSILISCVDNPTYQAPEGPFKAAFENSWAGTYTLNCDTGTHQFVIQKDGKATLDGALFLENGMAYGGSYELSRAIGETTASDVLMIGSLPQKAVKLLFVDGVFNKPISIKNGSSPAESCSAGTFTPAAGVSGAVYKLETLFDNLSPKFGSPRAISCKQSSFAVGSITASLSSSGISLSSNPVQSYTLSGASVVQRFDGSTLSYNTEITLKKSNGDEMNAQLNVTSTGIDAAAFQGSYNPSGFYACQ